MLVMLMFVVIWGLLIKLFFVRDLIKVWIVFLLSGFVNGNFWKIKWVVVLIVVLVGF